MSTYDGPDIVVASDSTTVNKSITFLRLQNLTILRRRRYAVCIIASGNKRLKNHNNKAGSRARE